MSTAAPRILGAARRAAAGRSHRDGPRTRGEAQRAGSAVRAKILFALSTTENSWLKPGDVLGAAEQQKARLVQAVVKRRQHALLQRLIEVDEDVAAAHQVQLRERRIAREVVPHEDAQVAHGLVDAVAASRPW